MSFRSEVLPPQEFGPFMRILARGGNGVSLSSRYPAGRRTWQASSGRAVGPALNLPLRSDMCMNRPGSRSQIHLRPPSYPLPRPDPHSCVLSFELCTVLPILMCFFFPCLDEQKKIMIMICCVILAIILASTIGGIFA